MKMLLDNTIFSLVFIWMIFILFHTKQKRGITWIPFFSIGFTILFFVLVHPHIKHFYKNIEIVPVIMLLLFPIAPLILIAATRLIEIVDFYLVRKNIRTGKFTENGLKFKWFTNLRIKKTKDILASGKLKNINPHLRKGLTEELFGVLRSGGTLSVTVILKLIQRGADFQSPNEEGEYPLMIGRGDAPKNQLTLLELGANVNIRVRGMTPFVWAAANADCSVLHAIIRKGGKTDEKDNEGKSALSCYIRKTGNIRFFVIYEEAKILVTLLQFCDINAQDNNGLTAIMHAVKNPDKRMLKFLIKSGAYLDLKSKSGKTALDYAREELNDSLIKILKKTKKSISEN